MKRLALFLLAFSIAILAGCGGGGNATPPPPPPVGGFTNADLKGQYAFVMSGDDGLAFFGRVGVFIADGAGNITGGVEDVNTILNGEQRLTFLPSTYSVQADGRGTLNLKNATGTLIFSITLVSPSQGLIVQTDNNQTASGTFRLQNPSAFTLASLGGNYVFSASGVDPRGFPDSIIGQLGVGGPGALSSGVIDENDDTNLSGPVPVANGAFSLDAASGATFGSGVMNFAGLSYIFYIVNAGRLVLMETGSAALTVGDAVQQSSNVPASNAAFNGSFVFLDGGASLAGPNVRLGRFTAAGGALTSVAMDENNNGSNSSVPTGTLSAAAYAVATTGSGRVTVTFTDSSLSKNGPFQFIAYMSSPTQGFIQDVTVGMVSSGSVLAQTGAPFTNANLAADYAFNWSGIDTNTTTLASAEADFVGHAKLTSASSNNATGVMDFSDFTSSQGFFLDVGIAGALTILGDGTNSSAATSGRDTFIVQSNNSPASTFNFKAYVVNPQTIYLLSTDKDRVIAGAMQRQSL